MTLHSALAAAATLVSLAFALSTLERWLARRKPHEAAWTVSLLLFAAGSAALWVASAVGWGAWSFRLFYLFGAVLNVPFLALGTIYLLGGKRRGDRWAAGVGLAAAFSAGAVLEAPMHAPIRPDKFPQGSEVFGALPRVLAAVGSGLFALVIVGGAVWSAVRLLAGVRERRLRAKYASEAAGSTAPDAPTASAGPLSPGRLAGANLLIAAGTLVLGAGGLFNSVLDAMDAFSVSLVIGIVLIFAGFLLTNAASPAAAHAGAAPAVAAETPTESGDAATTSTASAELPEAERSARPALRAVAPDA